MIEAHSASILFDTLKFSPENNDFSDEIVDDAIRDAPDEKDCEIRASAEEENFPRTTAELQTLNSDPEARLPLDDMPQATRRLPATDAQEPTLASPRTEKKVPNLKESAIEQCDPNEELPDAEKQLLQRASRLTERVPPKFALERTEKEPANIPEDPPTDEDPPILAESLSERLDPENTCLVTDTDDMQFATPPREKLLRNTALPMTEHPPLIVESEPDETPLERFEVP